VSDLPAFIGRYEIVSRLGQGGMGSLYLAKDPKIGRLVAIKLVRQDFDSPEARQRFAREAQSAGTLRHPNIVTIFDVDEFGGLPYIAMEYVDGETLSEIVRRKAPYAITKRLQWIEELCAGLAYAHRQGVVHRDIKPANLMLDNEGALKILDFGLARREASKFTQSQTIIGTPNYMSPEQIRAGDVGPRSDIFAVGSVLYEVLTCTEAFPGKVHQAMHKILYEEPKPLGQVLPQVDPGLVTILARALEKDPASRFPDLTVMRNDLALVRQRLERQDVGAPTIAMTPSPSPSRSSASAAGHAARAVDQGATPGSGPGSTPGSAPGSGGSHRGSGSAHRITLEKKRTEQIDRHLVEARKHCDTGAFDKAREEVEQALMFDPDHPIGLELIDEIAAEEERQQVAQFVAAARVELQQGRLEAAERIVAQALEVAPQSPEVQQLRETIDTTRREIDRARQVQDMLRRARTRFSEGSFEGAIRAVGELLAIDPNNAAARDLQARAQEAIDTRAHRAERDAAAQAAVTEARALFEKGDKESAIAMLETFTPPHDLVSGFLASLRGEQVAEALQEPALADATPVSSVSAASSPVASASRRKIDDTPRARTPIYAGLAVAVVAVVAVGWFLRPRAGTGVAPENPATTAATNTPAAAVIPPPAVVTPPASLTDQAPKNQNDRDAMEAYKLLSAGQPAEASKIVARIARRDPKNENLSDLRAQIQKVVDTEKQRTAAAPAASNAPAGAPGTGSPPAEKPATPAAGGDAGSTSPGGSADKTAAPAVIPPPPPEPAVAAAPPPVPAAEVERPAIEASIHEYAKALSSMSLPAVARVRKYTPAEAKNWENLFKGLAEYRLIVKITGSPTLDGDRATIPVEELVATTAKKGGIQVFQQARKTEYKLEKIGGRWMILPPG
jgi:serine/threonine protein kinase/Tfp pilus assembly protein PilF